MSMRVYKINEKTGEEREITAVRVGPGTWPEPFTLRTRRWPDCKCARCIDGPLNRQGGHPTRPGM